MTSVDDWGIVPEFCAFCHRLITVHEPLLPFSWTDDGVFLKPLKQRDKSLCPDCALRDGRADDPEKLIAFYRDAERDRARMLASPFGSIWARGTLYVMTGYADRDFRPVPPGKAFKLWLSGFFAMRYRQRLRFPAFGWRQVGTDDPPYTTFVSPLAYITYPGIPAYLEAASFLDEDQERKIEIKEWSRASRAQLVRLIEGVEFIKNFRVQPGPLPGSRTFNDAQEFRGQFAWALKRHLPNPRKEEVARDLYDDDTIKDLSAQRQLTRDLRTFTGRTWNDHKADGFHFFLG